MSATLPRIAAAKATVRAALSRVPDQVIRSNKSAAVAVQAISGMPTSSKNHRFASDVRRRRCIGITSVAMIAEVDDQPDAGGAGSAKVSGQYQEKRDAYAEREHV